MAHDIEIQMLEFVTHDVKRFVVTKPEGFTFEPGQGVTLSVPGQDSEDGDHPFTPTSHPEDEAIEFMIKEYPEREGLTAALHRMKPGERLEMSDAFGEIRYKGPGVFIAAGTGLTPFLAIIRTLARKGDLGGHSLIYSNKSPKDMICEKELRSAFGDRCHLTCTRDSAPGYDDRHVDRDYLEEVVGHWDQRFYICGPQDFVDDMVGTLEQIGASPDAMVHEG